jgi:hypothetical protein
MVRVVLNAYTHVRTRAMNLCNESDIACVLSILAATLPDLRLVKRKQHRYAYYTITNSGVPGSSRVVYDKQTRNEWMRKDKRKGTSKMDTPITRRSKR